MMSDGDIRPILIKATENRKQLTKYDIELLAEDAKSKGKLLESKNLSALIKQDTFHSAGKGPGDRFQYTVKLSPFNAADKNCDGKLSSNEIQNLDQDRNEKITSSDLVQAQSSGITLPNISQDLLAQLFRIQSADISKGVEPDKCRGITREDLLKLAETIEKESKNNDNAIGRAALLKILAVPENFIKVASYSGHHEDIFIFFKDIRKLSSLIARDPKNSNIITIENLLLVENQSIDSFKAPQHVKDFLELILKSFLSFKSSKSLTRSDLLNLTDALTRELKEVGVSPKQAKTIKDSITYLRLLLQKETFSKIAFGENLFIGDINRLFKN